MAAPLLQAHGGEEEGKSSSSRQRRVARDWWVESKLLWRIVGPAIFQRVALYGINVVAQAFIGHIGDLELAAFSIASTVVAGFNFGFLVTIIKHTPVSHYVRTVLTKSQYLYVTKILLFLIPKPSFRTLALSDPHDPMACISADRGANW